MFYLNWRMYARMCVHMLHERRFQLIMLCVSVRVLLCGIFTYRNVRMCISYDSCIYIGVYVLLYADESIGLIANVNFKRIIFGTKTYNLGSF